MSVGPLCGGNIEGLSVCAKLCFCLFVLKYVLVVAGQCWRVLCVRGVGPRVFGGRGVGVACIVVLLCLGTGGRGVVVVRFFPESGY